MLHAAHALGDGLSICNEDSEQQWVSVGQQAHTAGLGSYQAGVSAGGKQRWVQAYAFEDNCGIHEAEGSVWGRRCHWQFAGYLEGSTEGWQDPPVGYRAAGKQELPTGKHVHGMVLASSWTQTGWAQRRAIWTGRQIRRSNDQCAAVLATGWFCAPVAGELSEMLTI